MSAGALLSLADDADCVRHAGGCKARIGGQGILEGFFHVTAR